MFQNLERIDIHHQAWICGSRRNRNQQRRAGTGQNALSQAKLFSEAVGLTGITLTKLDGTAKGGVIFAVADKFQIPIRYIGVGEGIDDLRPFVANDFIEALFSREE